MNTKILTQAQAEAVYSAMRALNNIGAACLIDVHSRTHAKNDVHVKTNGGDVAVRVGLLGAKEAYLNQEAFAKAYGLQAESEG